MAEAEILPHLFRTEYRKIVSVLARHFGFEQIEIAEDIASDTFVAAAQTWAFNGLPENPVAWLYQVAKNKAKNHLQRNAVYRSKVLPEWNTVTVESPAEPDLSVQNINDSQLQMMFAISNDSISPESQIALSLRILCGFGVDEIARAFLTSRETINKRLFRARQKLREINIQIKIPDPRQINAGLGNVLRTIYLLFSEGYYSESGDEVLRKDLCLEAMRLGSMLIENETTNLPSVNALIALMCFHASRFEARFTSLGQEILYDEQDSSTWNTELISRGAYFLHLASAGDSVSKYHLEAAIAYHATRKPRNMETWAGIVHLYDQLLEMEYSPIAILNRIFAISKLRGKEQAIREAVGLNMNTQLYHLLLGDLYTDINNGKARDHLLKSLALIKSNTSKQTIQSKLEKLIV